MSFHIPGYRSLAQFARSHKLPYMTVKNHVVAGYCKYPYRPLEKDGRTKNSAYKIWDSMIGRCYYKSNASYKTYGAKGITVCSRWKTSFKNFIEDMGSRPTEKHTLDRIDNTKGYSKENCRWATYREQGRNTAKNKWISYAGEKLILTDMAAVLELSPETLASRLKRSGTVFTLRELNTNKGKW